MVRNITDDAPQSDFSARLRRLREGRGLSRRQLAQAAAVSTRRIFALERATGVAPSADEVVALAHCCNVPICELVPPGSESYLNGSKTSRSAEPDDPATTDATLRDYLGMLHELRGGGPVTPQSLRHEDLSKLALALGRSPEAVEARLVELLESSADPEQLSH
jgi:transcriptional regulator with XRE-family HTH domain